MAMATTSLKTVKVGLSCPRKFFATLLSLDIPKIDKSLENANQLTNQIFQAKVKLAKHIC